MIEEEREGKERDRERGIARDREERRLAGVCMREMKRESCCLCLVRIDCQTILKLTCVVCCVRTGYCFLAQTRLQEWFDRAGQPDTSAVCLWVKESFPRTKSFAWQASFSSLLMHLGPCEE